MFPKCMLGYIPTSAGSANPNPFIVDNPKALSTQVVIVSGTVVVMKTVPSLLKNETIETFIKYISPLGNSKIHLLRLNQ